MITNPQRGKEHQERPRALFFFSLFRIQSPRVAAYVIPKGEQGVHTHGATHPEGFRTLET